MGLLKPRSSQPAPTILSEVSRYNLTPSPINFYEIQKKNILAKLTQELIIISNRILFIQDIVDGNININTTPLPSIITYLSQSGYDKINDSFNYLLSMPIYTLNSQTLQDLQQLKTDTEVEINML